MVALFLLKLVSNEQQCERQQARKKLAERGAEKDLRRDDCAVSDDPPIVLGQPARESLPLHLLALPSVTLPRAATNQSGSTWLEPMTMMATNQSREFLSTRGVGFRFRVRTVYVAP